MPPRQAPKLSTRCRHGFSSIIRERGAAYHREGRVHVDGASEAQARATVRGSAGTDYSVSVRAADEEESPANGLEVWCSCPHFERGFACKHLWAFLLELDAIGRAPRVGDSAAVELLAPEDDEGVGFFLDDEDADDDEPFEAAVGVFASDPSDRPDALAWAAAAMEAPARRPSRAVHYVLSLAHEHVDASLQVRLFESGRSGAEGRLETLAVSPDEIEGRYAPEDEEALRVLLGCARDGPTYVSDYSGYGFVGAPVHAATIPAGLQPLVVPVLARTGRLFRSAKPAARPRSVEDLTPLRWDGASPFSVATRLVASRQRDAWQLELELRGTDPPRMEALDAVLGSGLVLAGERIVRLERPHLASLVAGFRRHGPIEADPETLPDLLARIAELPLLETELPRKLGWSWERGAPTGCLEIRSPTRHTPGTRLYADVYFDYGAERFGAWEARWGVADRARRRLVRRDPEQERELLGELEAEALAEAPEPDREGDVRLARRRMPEHVSALLARGWNVVADGVRMQRPSTPRLAVTTGVDWFDVEGEVSFGDQVVRLPELLAARAAGEATVALGDGSRGVLPAEWLERVGRLAELGQAEGDRLRFRPSQALLLDALLAEQPGVDVDEVFRRTCRRIARVGRPRSPRKPRGLAATLRPYQRQGLGWLQHMGELGLGGCLADDMGLGKTIQALALLVARRNARSKRGDPLPSLAVVPASLVHSWLAEAERFAPDLSALAYVGPGRAPLRDHFGEMDLVVTTYATLRRDVDKLAGQRFDCVLLDEAQAIKNAGSQVSKAARLLRAEQRVALSGTPVENHLGELWALFDFLNPGMLGPSARRARTLDDADADTVSTLGRALGPFILRRTKAEVLKDLPPKSEQTLTCVLESRQKRLYRELRDHYRSRLLARVDAQGMARSRIQVLEALLRLRQAACHPALVDPKRRDQPSAKLELLRERLDQTLEEGHKVLVFSQFTKLLALVRARLADAGIVHEYLDGRTRKRAERVARFQEDPDCRVFLVSLKAGGLGLNLTAADYVFLLDPWWNPAVESQAIDRAHRIGQTRPVFAYRLVAEDTIEEKILELQERKRRLADAIVSGASAGVRDLTREDLERLLA